MNAEVEGTTKARRHQERQKSEPEMNVSDVGAAASL
jgi:hypothetical protein